MPRRLREAKDRERGAWGAGSRARPAAEWRWLTYGYVLVGRGAPRRAVQMALDSADRRDRGAGATLAAMAAMAARGLIEERHDDIPRSFRRCCGSAATPTTCRCISPAICLAAGRRGRPAPGPAREARSAPRFKVVRVFV